METEETEEIIIQRRSNGRQAERSKSRDRRHEKTKSTETVEVDVNTKSSFDERRNDTTKTTVDENRPQRPRTSDGPRRNFKRLVVCCDGTWLDSSRTGNSGDNFMNTVTSGRYKDVSGRIIPPSNVTRLTRAIKSQSGSGIPQIVYYQAGVASMGTVGEKIVGGITGDGLAEYVREAYSFIANNYDDGDEIFLIGFSRGAFTARSIGGLIGNLGILTKAGLASFPVIYQDFAHRHDKRYSSPSPNVPFPNKPSPLDASYARELSKRRLTTLNVPIKAIAVYDTVGSLGIPVFPSTGFFSKVTEFFGDFSEFRFYDTSLDNCIENAFQALALDERRESFSPTLWERRNDNRTNLIQVWFPGVHSNVGGGYEDQELANITLAWMMSMLSPLLEINLDYIMTQDKENAQYYKRHGESPRAWSFGKIFDNTTGIYNLTGKIVRTPGDYYRMNPRTNEPTDKPLRDTNEYIHSSVRARYLLQGPGYGDKGIYNPPALKKWRLRTDDGTQGLPSRFFWEDNRYGISIPEAPLRSVEKKLLGMTPEVRDLVLYDKAPGSGGGGGGGGGNNNYNNNNNNNNYSDDRRSKRQSQQ